MKSFLIFLILLVVCVSMFAAGPYYVSSVVGSDANSGANWSNALGTVSNAVNIKATVAGDIIYVDPIHSESNTTALTLTSLGTAAGPIHVLCAANTNANPPTSLGTGAVIKNAAINAALIFNGFTYYRGFTFYANNVASTGGFGIGNNALPFYMMFETCAFIFPSGTSASRFNIGANGNGTEDDQRVEFYSTTVAFGNSGQGIAPVCPFYWRSTTSAVGGTIPTSLFLPTVGNSGFAKLIGVDLSAMGSGKSLVNVSAASYSWFEFTDCRLGASVSATTGSSAGQGGVTVRLINCNSTNVNYSASGHGYQGTVQDATDTYVTGGASDGYTSFSRKMTTTANTKYYSPLVSDPIIYWNDVTNSSMTVAVPFITDGVTLSNHQVWIEAEFLAAATNTLGYFTNTRSADILAAGVALTTDGATTWTTNGLFAAAPVKQKASLAFTPQMRGLIRVWVNSALPSTNFWFGPKLQVQ